MRGLLIVCMLLLLAISGEGGDTESKSQPESGSKKEESGTKESSSNEDILLELKKLRERIDNFTSSFREKFSAAMTKMTTKTQTKELVIKKDKTEETNTTSTAT